MVRSTQVYCAGLSACMVAGVAIGETVRLVERWSFKDGRSYAGYLFSDVNAILYGFVLLAGLGIGALAFRATRHLSKRWVRAALLTLSVPLALLVSAASIVAIGVMLQSLANDTLLPPKTVVAVFSGAWTIAVDRLAWPAVLAVALWSWFFCAR